MLKMLRAAWWLCVGAALAAVSVAAGAALGLGAVWLVYGAEFASYFVRWLAP